MKTTVLCLLLALSSVAVARAFNKPGFCKERDCPRFKQVDKGDGYETRTYEAAWWVWVEAEGDDPAEATMKAHAELYAYFHGANDASRTFEMGTPVAHNVSIREDDDGEASWARRRHRRHHEKVDMTVKAYLPYSFQDGKEGAPQPTSKNVHIEQFPEWTAHVIGFEGWPTPRNFMKHAEALEEYLEEDNKEYSDEYKVFSIYDPPYALEDRYNEVLFPAEEEDDREVPPFYRRAGLFV